MSKKKVKLKDGVLEYAPLSVYIEKDGVKKFIIRPSDEILKELGYKDLIESEPLPPEEGYRDVITYTETDDCVIEHRHKEKIIDPDIGHRKLSKGFLRIELIKLGYIDQFENLLKTLEIPLGDGKTLNGYTAWNDFLTIDEDSETFSPIIKQVKKAFNLSDEQYENIVKKCISKT